MGGQAQREDESRYSRQQGCMKGCESAAHSSSSVPPPPLWASLGQSQHYLQEPMERGEQVDDVAAILSRLHLPRARHARAMQDAEVSCTGRYRAWVARA